MDSDERGINPGAMTIISPRKGYGPSPGNMGIAQELNQQPPVLKFCLLPTELCGLAHAFRVKAIFLDIDYNFVTL